MVADPLAAHPDTGEAVAREPLRSFSTAGRSIGKAVARHRSARDGFPTVGGWRLFGRMVRLNRERAAGEANRLDGTG